MGCHGSSPLQHSTFCQEVESSKKFSAELNQPPLPEPLKINFKLPPVWFMLSISYNKAPLIGTIWSHANLPVGEENAGSAFGGEASRDDESYAFSETGRWSEGINWYFGIWISVGV